MVEKDLEQKAAEAESRRRYEEARGFVFNRQKAYQETFKKDVLLAQQVLSDLAKFCRAGESTFDADPRLHALKEGRREVWLRIQENLELNSEDLWKIVTRKGA